MKHIQKANQLFAKLRNRNWEQHEPNSVTDGHNDDVPETFDLYKSGQHPRSLGITSDYDWNQHPYKYYWNSLGLRGPEPNPEANKKIVAIGNSLTLGSGVPVEQSFIYKIAQHFKADYINISDNYVMTDALDPMKEILSWYKPNFIYLNEFRFIDAGMFLVWNFNKKYNLELGKSELTDVLEDSIIKTISMFEDTIRLYAPQADVIWDIQIVNQGGRPLWLGDAFTSKKVLDSLTFPCVTHTNTDILLDLGRDCKHPGIKGHNWMTQRLIKIIGEHCETFRST